MPINVNPRGPLINLRFPVCCYLGAVAPALGRSPAQSTPLHPTMQPLQVSGGAENPLVLKGRIDSSQAFVSCPAHLGRLAWERPIQLAAARAEPTRQCSHLLAAPMWGDRPEPMPPTVANHQANANRPV